MSRLLVSLLRPSLGAVSSPGLALAERERVERALARVAVPLMRAFLADVAASAVGTFGAQALTAAAPPGPFSAGQAVGAWTREVVERMVGQLGEWMGRDPDTDDYLRAVTARLNASEVPGRVFASAAAVLAAGATAGWAARRIAGRVREALTLDSPAVVALDTEAAGELVTAGASWDVELSRVVRAEATGAYNETMLGMLVNHGYREKTWISHHDDRVRATHLAVDGTRLPIDAAFDVGGWAMLAPADPSGPPHEVVNCRCILVGALETRGR